MAISDAGAAAVVPRLRHVRCPRCNSVLQEPTGVPVYQCGGCGASLRATFSSGEVDAPPLPSVSAPPPPPSSEGGGADLAPITTVSGRDAPSTGRRGADTTTASATSSPLSARTKHRSGEQSSPVVEKKEEDGVRSEPRSRGGSSRDSAELRDSSEKKRMEADAARKNRSGEAARHAAAAKEIAGDAAVRMMSPLHEKILKTVDDLRGELSDLFTKSPPSPEVEPSTPARPSPRRDSHAARPPASPVHASSRARHADTAAVSHRRCSKSAGYPGSKLAPPPRGLPSRRYRRCRADPCQRHCKHGAPECRSHCCGSRAAPKPPTRETKRRAAAPPRQHCRPVLKGAPFIVCSSCFTLVQVPAGFAVPNKKVSRLRCGSCSAVLSYSYRDPAGKKKKVHDPFSFMEELAHGQSCSYSTTDDDEHEQPLHVSRNSSLSTVVVGASGALHRLMGYGSARELLLLPRSPSLYERSTSPPDTKGKGVWVDDGATDFDFDDDDDDDSRDALRRSSVARRMARGGLPAPVGPIRIRS